MGGIKGRAISFVTTFNQRLVNPLIEVLTASNQVHLHSFDILFIASPNVLKMEAF